MNKCCSAFIIVTAALLSACLNTEDQTSSQNNTISGKSVGSQEEITQRQQLALANASAAPREFREGLKENCPHFNSILLTTAETIQLGTRLFNAGGIGLTNRIYEGAVYKILFTLKDDCMELSDALQAGIAKADSGSHHDKARALRSTLDLIMGGPPLRPPSG